MILIDVLEWVVMSAAMVVTGCAFLVVLAFVGLFLMELVTLVITWRERRGTPS